MKSVVSGARDDREWAWVCRLVRLLLLLDSSLLDSLDFCLCLEFSIIRRLKRHYSHPNKIIVSPFLSSLSENHDVGHILSQ